MTRDARTVSEAKIKSELGGQGDTAMGHSTSQNSTKEKEGGKVFVVRRYRPRVEQ